MKSLAVLVIVEVSVVEVRGRRSEVEIESAYLDK